MRKPLATLGRIRGRGPRAVDQVRKLWEGSRSDGLRNNTLRYFLANDACGTIVDGGLDIGVTVTFMAAYGYEKRSGNNLPGIGSNQCVIPIIHFLSVISGTLAVGRSSGRQVSSSA